MDLFRILRVSLYAMVAAGALSISLSEHNAVYIICALAFGALSFATLDSGILKPVREHYFGAMTLALWLYHFPFSMPDGADWNRIFLTALGHFLCSFQMLLFFRPYRDWILLVSGVSTLAVVIICGVNTPDATLLLRIAIFVAMTAWTLFIHSMWRAREDFSIRRMAAGRGNPSAALAPDAPRTMPERAFWQGLSMMSYLSISCLALGLFLFFSAPRLERLTAILDMFTPRRETKMGKGGRGAGNRGFATTVGFSEQVSINDMGPVSENNGVALSVTFSPAVSGAVDSQGRIYLRSMAMSRHANGVWLSTDSFITLNAEPGKTISISDPTAPDLVYNGPEIKQTVDSTNTLSNVFFAVAPVSRINAPSVLIDAEGVLRLPENREIQKYEIWSHTPVHQSDLPPDAVAYHPDRLRYVADSGLSPNMEEDVRRKAQQITANDLTALAKVRSIARYLRESGEYSYTLKLNELKRRGDPIGEFLMSSNNKERRGHCGYFASAFVTLCRLKGIPARMASGFVTSVSEQADAQSGKIVFKNSDAHAWGEVYFQNYGWVPFESTPAATGTEEKVEPVQPPPIADADKGTLTGFVDLLINWDGDAQRDALQKFGNVVKSGFGNAGAVMTGRSVGGWVVAGLAWLGAGFFIVWIAQLLMRRGNRKVARGSGGGGRSQAAISFYNDLLQVLQRRGYVRKRGQTPREFAEHVVRHGGDSFKSVLAVTQVFESVRYGGADISQEDFNLLQSSLDHLRELTFASAAAGTKS